MSNPVTMWSGPESRPPNLYLYPAKWEAGCVEHRALPAEEFDRMESDARAYRRVLDVIADPRLRDAPIAKTLADLGLDQSAGADKVMWFTMSGGPYPVLPKGNP